jgi:predicted dehydrogenase
MTDSLAGVKVELGTVVDPDTELAAAVARRYGFERASADVQDVIDDPSIDAVSVAVPNFLALPVLSGLLKAGKHVIGEKPLGRDANEAAKLVQTARAAHRVAGVGFSYRRVPALAQLRQAVRSGAVGKPYFARARYLSDYAIDPDTPATWRFAAEPSGGGTIIDMATHAIDLLEHTLGEVREVIACSLDTVIDERPSPAGSPLPARVPVSNDDTALIDLRFTQGALASVLASRVAAGCPNELGIEVYGSRGHVAWSLNRVNEWVLYERGLGAPGQDAPRTILTGPDSPYFADTMPMVTRGNPVGYGEAFVAEMQEFLRAIVDGRPMDTSFEVAANTMRVVEAAFISARNGRPTPVGPPLPALGAAHQEAGQ